MKATANTKKLINQLERLAQIPGTKGLSGYLIEFNADITGITMKRSGGNECLASVSIEADVKEESEEPYYIPHDMLAATIGRMPGESTSFETKSDAIILTSGDARKSIPLQNSNEWQEIDIPEIALTEVDAPRLLEAIGICIKAVGKDSAGGKNDFCMGVHFLKADDDRIWCIAADRKRLHACQTDLEDFDCSINTASAHALLIIAQKQQNILMGMTQDVARFVGSDFEITFPLMTQRIPFSGMKPLMFPAELKPCLTASTQELIDGLRYASHCAKNNGVAMGSSKGFVFLIGKNDSREEATMRIECKHNIKDSDGLCVNGPQVVEALQSLGEETAEITQFGQAIHFTNREKDRIFSSCMMMLPAPAA